MFELWVREFCLNSDSFPDLRTSNPKSRNTAKQMLMLHSTGHLEKSRSLCTPGNSRKACLQDRADRRSLIEGIFRENGLFSPLVEVLLLAGTGQTLWQAGALDDVLSLHKISVDFFGCGIQSFCTRYSLSSGVVLKPNFAGCLCCLRWTCLCGVGTCRRKCRDLMDAFATDDVGYCQHRSLSLVGCTYSFVQRCVWFPCGGFIAAGESVCHRIVFCDFSLRRS